MYSSDTHLGVNWVNVDISVSNNDLNEFFFKNISSLHVLSIPLSTLLTELAEMGVLDIQSSDILDSFNRLLAFLFYDEYYNTHKNVKKTPIGSAELIGRISEYLYHNNSDNNSALAVKDSFLIGAYLYDIPIFISDLYILERLIGELNIRLDVDSAAKKKIRDHYDLEEYKLIGDSVSTNLNEYELRVGLDEFSKMKVIEPSFKLPESDSILYLASEI